MKTFVDSATITQLWWHYHRDNCVTPRVMRDRLRALASKIIQRNPDATFVTLFHNGSYSLGEALFDAPNANAGQVRVFTADNDDTYREIMGDCNKAILLPVPSTNTRLVRCWYSNFNKGQLRTGVKNKSVLDLSTSYIKYFSAGYVKYF